MYSIVGFVVINVVIFLKSGQLERSVLSVPVWVLTPVVANPMLVGMGLLVLLQSTPVWRHLGALVKLVHHQLGIPVQQPQLTQMMKALLTLVIQLLVMSVMKSRWTH